MIVRWFELFSCQIKLIINVKIFQNLMVLPFKRRILLDHPDHVIKKSGFGHNITCVSPFSFHRSHLNITNVLVNLDCDNSAYLVTCI